MDIPKRPVPLSPEGAIAYAWDRYHIEKELHEHAVAKKAVETLRKLEYVDDGITSPLTATNLVVREVLREIDASGWKE